MFLQKEPEVYLLAAARRADHVGIFLDSASVAHARKNDSYSPNSKSNLQSRLPMAAQKCTFYASHLPTLRDNVTMMAKELMEISIVTHGGRRG